MTQELIQAQVQRCLAAYRANDLAAYFGCIADDATVMIGGKGRANKAMYQAVWRPVVEAGGGVVDAEVEDLQVRAAPSGDAGVATFFLNVSYRGIVPGQPDAVVKKRLAMTEAWFKTGDTWQLSHVDWFDAPPNS